MKLLETQRFLWQQHAASRRGHCALPALSVALILVSGNAAGAPAVKAAGAGALYQEYCAVCHGDKGDGRSRARTSLVPPPKDFTQPSARNELSRDYMIAITREGKPGTAMVGWKRQLNDRQIAGIVDYIRTTFMQLDLPKNLARGRDIYQTTCSVCHGDKGDGRSQAQQSLKPPPRDFTSAGSELTRSHMIFTVSKGHPKTAMVSFASQLSRPDIEAVVDYVRMAFMSGQAARSGGALAQTGKHPDAGSHSHHGDGRDHGSKGDASQPFPKGLRGNVARGGELYAANCVPCHGKKGDGKGPRAYFINPKPRNFLEPSSRESFNRPDLFSAISIGRRGSEMPAWKTVLNDQQIADVAEYVFRTFLQPPAKAQASAAGK